MSSQSHSSNQDDNTHTVFGGTLELAVAVSSVMEFAASGLTCPTRQGAFEVDPIVVFKNMLSRGTERGPDPEGTPEHSSHTDSRRVTPGEASIKNLGWTDLLSVKKFRVERGVVVLNAHDRAGWLVSMVGLNTPGKTVSQRRGRSDLSTYRLNTNDTIILSTLA